MNTKAVLILGSLAALALASSAWAGATPWRQRCVRNATKADNPAGPGEDWSASSGKDYISYWWNRHCKDHPGFFAQRDDGKRLPWGAPDNARELNMMDFYTGDKRKMWHILKQPTLCPTADGLVEALLDDWKKDGMKYPIALGDSTRRMVCQCEKCKALDMAKPADGNDEAPDWYSDRYVNLANRVVAEARKVKPDARVCVPANWRTLRGPAKEKLADGVYPVLTPLDFRPAKIDALLKAWKDAGMKECYFRGSILAFHVSRLLPLGAEKFVYDFAKKLADVGCVGGDFLPGPGGPFDEYAVGILCGFLNDPSKSFEALEDEVAKRQYGAGAGEAKAYFAFFRKFRDAHVTPVLEKLAAAGETCLSAEISKKPELCFKSSDFAEAAKLLKSPAVERLRLWNEQARLMLKAIEEPSVANADALLSFRDANGFELLPNDEKTEDGKNRYGLDVTKLYSVVRGAPYAKKADPKAKKPSKATCLYQVKSTLDGELQPVYFYAGRLRNGERLPLYVQNHSWSYPNSTFTDKQIAEMIATADREGHAFLLPNFRGPNNNPKACGSDYAVQDIVDAIDWAKKQAPIDDDRVYIIGGSGGGHMALLMAGRHPEIFAGVCACCPITDCARWYVDSVIRGQRYAGMLAASCGGSPVAHNDEYAHRSPLTWLERARYRKVPVYIMTGIHDGHIGSVPCGHAMRAYNLLADEKDRISEKDIAFMEETEKVPEHLAYKGPRDPHYVPEGPDSVLMNLRSANVRFVLMDAGHSGNMKSGFYFLSRQRRGMPADWTLPEKADVGTLEEITK